MKAFNIEAGQAEHIIDSVNEVANSFSVSSADLAKNLGNMSEIMAINNVSMEEQIGMLTGVTEITRNASSASRGLVMISSRLTQVLDDTSSTGKKLTKIYNDLGIELKDENGQLRSHYDILGDLAGKWNTLSENQQKYIALTSAGARQQQNFVALMANWSQVAKATSTAYESMGSAQRENEKVMDSVAKKVEILKSQFQQLVIGKGGLQDFAKTILDIGIALLKFANSDVGKTVIKVTELIAIITLLNKGILALPKMAESLSLSMLKLAYSVDKASLSEAQQAIALKAMGVAEGEATVTTGGLAASFEALTAAMMANPIMLVVTGLVLLAGALIYASKKQEEYNERIRETKEEIQELKNEIYNLKLATEDEAKVSQAEKDKLKYLEKRLELQKKLVGIGTTPYEEAKERATQAAMRSGTGAAGAGEFVKAKKQAEAIFNPKLEETELGNYIKLNKEIENWNDNSEKGLELLEQKFNQSQAYLTSLEAERDRLGKLRDTYAQNKSEKEHLLSLQERGIPLSEEENKRLEELSLSRTELSQADAESLDVLEKNIGAYHKSIDAIKTYQEAVDEYGEGTEEADSIITEFAKDLQMSEEEFIANADAMHLSIDGYYEYAKAVKAAEDAVKTTSESIDGLQDALTKAQKAQEQYNETGALTLDTFQDLMTISAEHLVSLVNENGQIQINKQSLDALVETLKREKVETLQAAETKDILAYAYGDVNKMSGLAKKSIADCGDSVKTSGDKAQVASGQYWSLAEAVSAANAAAEGDVIDATHIEANIQKIHNAYAKLGNQIYKTKIGAVEAGSAATKAGKAAKSAGKEATDAAKEAKKELEDLIKKYEQVIKYINKRYDREIKKIKDAKSEAVKAEEKKIKAVEKEKDHALDAIEKEIKALKKEQDARKQYWSDRIDTLKKQNDALKDSLELQEKLDALEKARNTKVKIYKEGQGFVYDVDQTAVAEAQKELDEYLSQKAYEDELERLEALKDAELDNYEKRLDALNEYKDSVQENYEKQIEQMNEYKDQLSEQYDAQIDKWEEYKEQFGDLVDQYEEQQNKLLFEQLMGIKDENSNWLTRLDNLAEFVRKYNELQNKLNTGDTSVTNTATMKEGTGGGSGTRSTSYQSTKTSSTPQYDSRGFKLNEGYSSTSSSSSKTAYVPTSVAKALGGKSGKINYASGTSSIKDDQIAVVGENPNQEIVIGSKINNGELMNLGKGTGVVNADSSKTLAGMLNQVGQFGASGFGSGNGTLNNNINNDSLVVNGVTIQGSNIKDPETFVNGLLNLKAEALQRAYKHR